MRASLNPSDLLDLDRIVVSLKTGLGDRLVSIVLFGSKARRDEHPDSDWDLLVIARELPEHRLERLFSMKEMLPDQLRSKVSLLAKTPEEFESSLPALYLDIALDGIVQYDPRGYAREKIRLLRNIINRKGLKRNRTGRDFFWQWDEFPGFGWSLEWEGSD
jgi:predicted nucleotidyltransferase